LFVRVNAGLEGPGVYRLDVDGGRRHERVLSLDAAQSFVPSGFSPDGRYLIFTVIAPKTGADIWFLPWGASPDLGRAEKLVAAEADESQGQLSPDGRWLAYYAGASGPAGGVYVRAFRSGTSVSAVGVEGAREPRWSPDGTRLYFRVSSLDGSRTGSLFESQVTTSAGGSMRFSTTRRMAAMPLVFSLPVNNIWGYDTHPDGKRILLRADADSSDPTINIITNWQ
jgi:Tol biopolymer transport system component